MYFGPLVQDIVFPKPFLVLNYKSNKDFVSSHDRVAYIVWSFPTANDFELKKLFSSYKLERT